jgi:peptide/nickel transport system permease protein
LGGVSNGDFSGGLKGWNWTKDSARISVDWEQQFGVDNGSLKVEIQRNETGNETVLYGKSKVSVYYDFYFPYSGPPARFTAGLKFFVNGITFNQTIKIYAGRNYTTGQPTYKYRIQQSFVIVPQVNVFLQRLSDGKKWFLWPVLDPKNQSVGSTLPPNMLRNGTIVGLSSDWATVSVDSKDPTLTAASYPGALNVAVTTFSSVPGNFRYGIEINFFDTLNSTMRGETSFYLDQVSFACRGTAYGLLGTDSLARDIFSQLIYGSRISLIVGVLSAVIGVVLGLVVGLAAGYLGLVVDEVLMRFSDFLLVIPFLPLMMVLMSILGPKIENLILILGFLGWMGFARVVRSQVLSLKERPFIEAARSVGAGRTHIIFRHILPNVMALVYVTLATSVPGAITAEAALSFLGLYDPLRMSWGRILNEAVYSGGGALSWWWVVFPGLCIAFLAMAFVLLGFALDEVLNPKLRLRR